MKTATKMAKPEPLSVFSDALDKVIESTSDGGLKEILLAVANGRKIKLIKRINLETELSKYENLPLECDGMCRVLTYALKALKVKHQPMIGHFTVDGSKAVPIHWWIVLEDGKHIDYRARMWGGAHDYIPNGIFNPADFKRVVYTGQPHNLKVDEKIFKILTEMPKKA